MRQQISLVDIYRFNDTLKTEFGEGIITAIVEKLNNSHKNKTFYIQYESATQEQINRALELAQQDNQIELKNVKRRVYDKMNSVMNKLISLNIKTDYTAEEIQEAKQWLQDTTQSCPVFIIGIALQNDITNIEAAQKIVQEDIDNTSYINNLKQLVSDTITFVAESNNVEECIAKIQLNIETMRSL